MASGLDHYERKIEAIAESFTCFVCIRLAENPHHCVHCGKIGCFTCIEQCLKINSLCPHCRTDLEIEQLNRLGWYADVIDNLKALQTSDKCSVHSKLLNLYCSDCRESICYKCVVVGETHCGHMLNPLEDVYSQYVKEISQEISLLQEKMQGLLSNVELLKENGIALKQKRDEEAREYVEEIVKRSNKKFNEELERLSQESTLVITGIENMLQTGQEQLKNSSQSTLIHTSTSIFKDLEEAKNKLENFVLPKRITIPNEITPRWRKEIVVIDFTQVMENTERVYSQALELDGSSWKMAVYRNTSDDSAAEDYLGVAVRLCETTLPQIFAEMEVRVEMCHLSGSNHFKQTRVYTFSPETEEFTIDDFYRIDLLSSEGFLDSETDSLGFTFSIRSPRFFEECKKLRLIISQLSEKLKINDEKIKELDKKQETLSNCQTGPTRRSRTKSA